VPSVLPNLSVWRSNEAAMSDLHEVYLNLGSNIEPEDNLVKAIKLLYEHGDIKQISNVWETKPVGVEGANFLNLCLLFVSKHPYTELKEQVIHPIESKLGRKRGGNKYASRTMDIDVIIFDGNLTKEKYWGLAFVIVPLAEIYPDYQHPITHENVSSTATRLRREVWMKMRPEVSSQLDGSRLKGQS